MTLPDDLQAEVEAIAAEMSEEELEAAMDDVEAVEPPERVDVSDYSTAAGAAKATHRALQEWAEFYGSEGDADQVVIYDPEETRSKRDMRGGDAWTVAWEGGPHEWAVALTGGESLGWCEFGGSADPEVFGFHENDEVDVECYYSFDLQFYNR